MSPKRERPGDAEINASRRRLGILSRPQAARNARVDSVRAECAFGGDADAGIVSTQLLIDRRLFAEGELPFFNLVARLVGARHGAGGAADTKIVDNVHDAVGFADESRWSGRPTRREDRRSADNLSARRPVSHSGYSPTSMSSTRRHCTPGGVALACLHAAVQVWQPMHRRRSATMT